MNEYPDFAFVSSSAAIYEWVEQHDPVLFAEIQRRVAEGRWTIVGGWWIEPDCNIPGGESFVRQGLYGQHYFIEKFGVTAKVAYNVDSFGHNGMLPQILKKSGMPYYIFMRPSPHEKGLPGRLFWWEADDGSRVLTFRIAFSYGTWGEDLEPHIRNVAAEIKEPLNELMCFYGVGNHGGGPTIANIDSIHRLQDDPTLPQLVMASPETFFTDLAAQELVLPVVHEDLQHHASGCYSAHSAIKQWNRKAENRLLAAEKLSTIASLATGQPYPSDFQRAWKNVLFNQFHDILAGTSLEIAYEDARDQFGEALAIASRALNQAAQALAWKINIEAEGDLVPIVVLNPHAWEVKTNVEVELAGLSGNETLIDDSGHVLPIQCVQSMATTGWYRRLSFIVTLPPLGYRLYRLYRRQNEQVFPTVEASPTVLANSRYRLEIDPQTGCICSLVDRSRNLEIFSGSAAAPVVIDDPSDTWSHNVFTFNHVVGKFTAQKVELVEQGPVKSIIRVTSGYNRSTLVQEFAMYNDLDSIEVSVNVDWREEHKMLKLRFPVNVEHMKACYEIPYGHIERMTNGEEEPGQSWIDLSGLYGDDRGTRYGLSILNDAKYSYDVALNDIGLTVLRSPIYAHHMPYQPQAETRYTFIDQGVQKFHYTLLPHENSWEEAGTVRRAAELNQRPVVVVATFHQGSLPSSQSYASVDQANLILSVLKQAEDNEDWIVRCYETAGAATQGTIHIPTLQRTIQAEFGPCEIKTFRVPRDSSLPASECNLLEWEEG